MTGFLWWQATSWNFTPSLKEETIIIKLIFNYEKGAHVRKKGYRIEIGLSVFISCQKISSLNFELSV